jgi:hypothetical protein
MPQRLLTSTSRAYGTDEINNACLRHGAERQPPLRVVLKEWRMSTSGFAGGS